MSAKWFSCTTLPLGTGVCQQNFPRTRGLRETTLRNPGVRRFVLKLVRLMLVRPTFYLPQVRFAPYSPFSRRNFRTSSTSPTSLTSEFQNEAIHRAISENAEQSCDRHQPIKLLVTNHLCNIHQYGRVIFYTSICRVIFYTSIWQSYILHINMQSYILHINMAELYSTHQYGRVIFYTSIWQSYILHINMAELYSTHQYGRVIFYTSIWQSYILHINMAELYSTHQYGRVIFYTSIWQSYILHINMAELYSTHQYGRVIFYTSIWQSYILHINMAELYSTHQYGRVIFYTSIWQSYILHINMAELYSTHQYGRVIFYTSIWQSYILHINMAELYSTHQYGRVIFYTSISQCVELTRMSSPINVNEYSLYNGDHSYGTVKPKHIVGNPRLLVWQWNQNPDKLVYRYTNVLQSNWAGFNKHYASTDVDLSYVDSSVKPWWMPQWRRNSKRDCGSDDIWVWFPAYPQRVWALWWQWCKRCLWTYSCPYRGSHPKDP